jgi:hypothetical protein
MKQEPMQQETLWITKAKEGDHKAFRALYSMKLQILQQMIEQGEIEL